MPWCDSFVHRPLPPGEIRKRIDKLYRWCEKTFPSDACFNLKWVADMLRVIDRMWYDRKLLQSIIDEYGSLELEIDESNPMVAAYVWESDDRDEIYMCFNRILFHRLHFEKDRGYHSGGILCRTQLQCFMHIVLHESIHLLLTYCDKVGIRPDDDHHNDEFQRIALNLFGQSDPQHGLIEGLLHKHDLPTIRQNLKNGCHVTYFRKRQNRWIFATVVRIKSKDAVVIRQGHKEHTVHPGLLKLCD